MFVYVALDTQLVAVEWKLRLRFERCCKSKFWQLFLRIGGVGLEGGSLGLGLDWGCGQYVCSWTDCWPKLCHGSALIKSLNIDANCKCNAISLTVACNVVASAIYHQREFVARDFCVAIRHKRKLCEVVWLILSQYFCASHQKRMKKNYNTRKRDNHKKKSTIHLLLLLLLILHNKIVI